MIRTALDTPAAHLDQSEQDFVAKVREYGWTSTGVASDEVGPGFVFSTGFWITAGHPEVIIFGLAPQTAHDVLWQVFRNAKAARPLLPGQKTEAVFTNLPAYAFSVAEQYYPDYFGRSRWFYGGNHFPSLQIVWPDRQGAFPWEVTLNARSEISQPDLTAGGWMAALVN